MACVLAIIGALGLAGCGLATSYEISQMTPDELTKVSDADLCRPGGTSPAVTAERQKRDLGDCDRDHLYCHSLGLKTGTDGYVQCRLKAREIAAQEGATQQAASSAMLRASATLLAQPPPVPPPPMPMPTMTTTNCNAYSNTLNCTSLQH